MFRLTPREVESPSRRKSARNWSEEILFQKMAIPDTGRACCAPLRRFVWRRKRERRVHSRCFAFCRWHWLSAQLLATRTHYWEIYKDTWPVNWTVARRKFKLIVEVGPCHESPRLDFLLSGLPLRSFCFSTSFLITYDIAVSLLSA